MDKQSNSTAAPTISTLIMGTGSQEILLRLSVDELKMLSMKEMRALMALFTTVEEAAGDFLNQARFISDGTYNAAGEIGDNLLVHFSWCIAMVEQVAKEASPATAEDAEDRAWLLIQRAAHYSENLADFVAVAAQLSVEASEVEAA